MAVILTVVYSKGFRGFSGIVIGGILGLDVFFLGFISGALNESCQVLVDALLSGIPANLWLYWTPFLLELLPLCLSID
jgi:aquaporin Z